MDTKKVDTSYQSFSSCLQELRDTLHRLHDFIDTVDETVVPGDAVLTRNLFHVMDHITCLMRDLQSGHIDYTNKPSSMFNVNNKQVFLLAFRKAYVNSMNVLDDYFLDKLHTPFWVCRHTMANGKQLWSLSNIVNEIGVLMSTVTHVRAVIDASPLAELN